MKKNIAFIGTVGVPNKYGGFEMFLEACTPKLAVAFDKVLVTCDKSRYTDHYKDWEGVERVFIPMSANGALSVFHDLLAFLAVFWRVQAIVVLGVSGGIFFPLLRLICALFNVRLIVNVDGVEWRRAKFSRAKRYFLFVSDRLAQLFSHRVVVDSEALRPFLAKKVRTEAIFIAYPGDHVVRRPEVTRGNGLKFLTICRIEPENNCDILLHAFAKAGVGEYTFIGNWNASEYGRKLRERFKGVKGLEMRNPEYDKSILANLRESCTSYLHGHSVGGTNPSLVEMLFYDSDILVFDCAFNRATADAAVRYFSDEQDLATKMQRIPLAAYDRTAVRKKYSSEGICAAYVSLIENAIDSSRTAEAVLDDAEVCETGFVASNDR